MFQTWVNNWYQTIGLYIVTGIHILYGDKMLYNNYGRQIASYRLGSYEGVSYGSCQTGCEMRLCELHIPSYIYNI